MGFQSFKLFNQLNLVVVFSSRDVVTSKLYGKNNTFRDITLCPDHSAVCVVCLLQLDCDTFLTGGR